MRKVYLIILAITLLGIAGCVSSPSHEHDFQLKYDDTYHYLECKCGERDGEKYKHNYEWICGDDPTLASRECVECNWVYNYDQVFSKPVFVKSNTIGGGSEPSLPPIMSYEILSDKGCYSIGEEFEIVLRLNLNHPGIMDGQFCVKLATSPYYEIIGEDEYVIDNFIKSDYQDAKNSFVDFKFKVCVAASSSVFRSFEFKIKCNSDENYMSFYEISNDSLFNVKGYYDPSCEYSITICDLSFMISSEDVVLGKNNAYFLFDSLNKQYISEKLSQEEYVSRIYEVITADMSRINCFESNDKYNSDCISYVSKNIKARLYLIDSFEDLNKKYKQNSASLDKEIALELIEILFLNGMINESQYESEKNYISSSAVGRMELMANIQSYQMLVPFYLSEYDGWLIYNQKETLSAKTCAVSDFDVNSASIYLKDSIVSCN